MHPRDRAVLLLHLHPWLAAFALALIIGASLIPNQYAAIASMLLLNLLHFFVSTLVSTTTKLILERMEIHEPAPPEDRQPLTRQSR